MDQLTEFVTNNLILFAALIGVLVMLIKSEMDYQTTRGLLLSPSKAIRLMNNHDDALILDVRSVAEYNNGHIKGAKNLPLSDLAGGIEKYSDYKNKSILLYCNSGNTVMRAIKTLKGAGFVKINNLEGGIAAWKEANMPLSKQ